MTSAYRMSAFGSKLKMGWLESNDPPLTCKYDSESYVLRVGAVIAHESRDRRCLRISCNPEHILVCRGGSIEVRVAEPAQERRRDV